MAVRKSHLCTTFSKRYFAGTFITIPSESRTKKSMLNLKLEYIEVSRIFPKY